jgi:glycerol-3-phosphate O-acyltransferase/dihydroxyacetone phosphate acyltransferase
VIGALVRGLLRLGLHAYFRGIDVEGAAHVPARGPVLLVSNHVNGLADPLFFMHAVRRPVVFTAKSALARNPLLRLAMRACGVITFERREDMGTTGTAGDAQPARDGADNREALARAATVLERGGALCVFPEGKSHGEVQLRRFRTGAARIALDVAARGHPLAIVPAALWFVSKGRFRSDVWVRFGEPIAVGADAQQGPEAVRALTDEMVRRVSELALTFENRRERWVLEWAADLVLTGAADPAMLDRDPDSAARRAKAMLDLRARYLRLRESDREKVAMLADRVQAFRHRLRKEGVAPAELFLSLDPMAALWFAVREAEILLVGLPLAALGAVFHALPFLAVRAIARHASRSEDHWAAFAIYPGALVFPVWYLGAAVLAFALLPWYAATALLALAPFAGAYALLYRDRESGALRRLETFLRLLTRPEWRRELREQGSALISELEAARVSS